MAQTEKYVSVICPFRGGLPIIEGLLAKLVPLLIQNYKQYEIVLVEDDPAPESRPLIDKALGAYPNIRYLKLSRHSGTEAAVAAGLDAAHGEVIVVMQPSVDPIALIPELVKTAMDSGAFVLGRRKSADGKVVRAMQKPNETLGRKIVTYLLGADTAGIFFEDTVYFSAMSRTMVKELASLPGRYRYLNTSARIPGFDVRFHDYSPYRHFMNRPLEESAGARLRAALRESTSLPRHLAVLFVILGLFCFLGLIGAGISGYRGYLTDEVSELAVRFALACGLLSLLALGAAIILYLDRIMGLTKAPYYVAEERRSTVTFGAGGKDGVIITRAG